MIAESYIKQLIDQKLADTDVFLVDFRVKTDNKIRVFIDSERGITIDDCIALSRHIEGNLDREQDDFALDVSSAGLDLPLRIPRQYKKNIGRKVHVILTDGVEMTGEITDAAEDYFCILPEIKKTKKSSKTSEPEVLRTILTIPYINQKETKIVLTI